MRCRRARHVGSSGILHIHGGIGSRVWCSYLAGMHGRHLGGNGGETMLSLLWWAFSLVARHRRPAACTREERRCRDVCRCAAVCWCEQFSISMIKLSSDRDIGTQANICCKPPFIATSHQQHWQSDGQATACPQCKHTTLHVSAPSVYHVSTCP